MAFELDLDLDRGCVDLAGGRGVCEFSKKVPEKNRFPQLWRTLSPSSEGVGIFPWTFFIPTLSLLCVARSFNRSDCLRKKLVGGGGGGGGFCLKFPKLGRGAPPPPPK